MKKHRVSSFQARYPLHRNLNFTTFLKSLNLHSGSITISMYCLRLFHFLSLSKKKMTGTLLLNYACFTLYKFILLASSFSAAFRWEIVYQTYQLIIQLMCIDDYEFRLNYTGNKICRKFTFVTQQDFAKSYLVNIAQFESNGDIYLSKILTYLISRGLQLQNKQLYLPKFNAIILPFIYCQIRLQLLNEKQIIFKVYPIQKDGNQIQVQEESKIYEDIERQPQNYYCRFPEIPEVQKVFEIMKLQNEELGTKQPVLNLVQKMEVDVIKHNQREVMMEQQNSFQYHHSLPSSQDFIKSEEDHQKRSKMCQRIISDVIYAVKVWRKLYQSKCCNLTKAALMVGISKKSLDDYYLVLRIGDLLNFDFQNNLSNKMGDLRAFIKSSGQKITGKLGKDVKCFKFVSEIDVESILKTCQIK